MGRNSINHLWLKDIYNHWHSVVLVKLKQAKCVNLLNVYINRVNNLSFDGRLLFK